MSYAYISGTGSYLPSTILSNAMLESLVNTNDEWIMKRVGIRERHTIAQSDDDTITMATKAAQNALSMAAYLPSDIDMIVVATTTPVYHFPSNACVIQAALGIEKDIPVFDLNAACTGFIYALNVASQFIAQNVVRSVLVIGVDALTQLVDWTDRGTCVLFGDGAGAVVLTASTTPGLLDTRLFAQGAHAPLITSRRPLNQVSPHIHMRGNEVFKIAVQKLGDVVDQALASAPPDGQSLDWLIPHQANSRIIHALAKRINLPIEKVIMTLESQGNTSSASIPLALDVAVRDGRIQRGQLLLFAAFGAGLTWGSALVRF